MYRPRSRARQNQGFSPSSWLRYSSPHGIPHEPGKVVVYPPSTIACKPVLN